MDRDDYFYRHLRKSTFKDKEMFLWAAFGIENSFTGRIDMLVTGLHRFFLESAHLIRNAIKLYEEGFFDAAFYSVRSALELARVVTYFSNENELQDSEEYKNWKKGGKFPFDSEIRKELEASGSIYTEINKTLQDFFSEQRSRLLYVQKYIHKQGYRTFYERGFINAEKEKKRQEIIADDFYQFIKGALAEIAFLRLCIDPFPILLRDSRVKYKIHFQGMTEPFSDEFVNQIIGEDKVERYCATEIYLSVLGHFGDNEELTEEAYTLINSQYYDRKTWAVIQTQMHLFSKNDTAAVKIFNTSNKIAKIYMLGGWLWYFSDVDTPAKYTGFSSEDLFKIKDSEVKINSIYKESYMSYFNFGDDGLWIEHNELLNKFDISEVEKAIASV